MDVTEVKFQPATFNEKNGFKKFPEMKAGKFRTKQVCELCNNGWMSALEVWFQEKLGFLVESTWPILAAEMIKNLQKENESLIRWMIKSAVIFEKASPKGLQQVVPDAVRIMAKNGGLTSDFFLMLGHIQVPRLTAQLMKGFPVWNGGVYHDYQVHDRGFTFAVCLNHLAIRIVKCPDASPIIKAHITTPGIPTVPLWLKPARNYNERVIHSFPNFQSFWDTLELRAN
jgi:hypothetical protein